jgi:hypothetical protein
VQSVEIKGTCRLPEYLGKGVSSRRVWICCPSYLFDDLFQFHNRGGQTKSRFVESSQNRDLESSSKPRFEIASGGDFGSIRDDSDFDFPPS